MATERDAATLDASDTAIPAVYAHPAAVERMTDVATAQRVAAESGALDPSIFEDNPPFFWRALISNNQLDSYYTKMDISSLQNYAADAQDGVSFLNSHNNRILPFGRSIAGTYVGPGGDGVAKVQADFFTIPGLNLNGVNTDDLILGMRAGIVKDVSIGFVPGSMECSICGLDVWDWDCPHIPGLTYPIKDSKGNTTEELAFSWVKNARLAEVSAVYEGATPGAAIIKARQQASDGRLKPESIRILEARYRIHLPTAPRAVAGATIASPRVEESRMPPEQERQQTPPTTTADVAVTPTVPPSEPTRTPESTSAPAESTTQPDQQAARPYSAPSPIIATVRELLSTAGIPVGEDIPAAVRAATDELVRLRPLADDGRTYRSDLVRDALTEGARALGTGFSEETYRGILETSPLPAIKRMRDDWRSVGDKMFVGGRASVEGTIGIDEDLPKPRARPDRAFSD